MDGGTRSSAHSWRDPERVAPSRKSDKAKEAVLTVHLPRGLDSWLRVEAKSEHCSTESIVVRALVSYRAEAEVMNAVLARHRRLELN